MVALKMNENAHKCTHGHGHSEEPVDYEKLNAEFDTKLNEFLQD